MGRALVRLDDDGPFWILRMQTFDDAANSPWIPFLAIDPDFIVGTDGDQNGRIVLGYRQ